MSILNRPLAALALSSLALAAQAQTAPDGQWHGSASLGAAFASGNTSSRALAGSVDAARATAADKLSLYGVANYASNKASGKSVTTSNLLRAGTRYDYNLSDRLFAFGGAEAETNKAGGLQQRWGLNGGLGYKLVRTPETTWDVFGGLGYEDVEYTSGLSQDGLAFVLGEESAHKLSTTTTAKQRLVFYPGTGDLGHRATFDAGVAVALGGAWT